MTEKKRIVWIDQLRAVAFYFVILGHMSISGILKNWVYSFHMPLFFFISGLNLNIEKIYKTPFTEYFSRLFKRMVVPYLWLQMLSFLLRQASAFINQREVPVPKLLLGILVSNNNLVSSPSNPLYYILLLFAVQLMLWFLIKIMKANKERIGVFLFVFSLLSVFTERISLPLHVNVIPMGMLLVFIGRVLMDFYMNNREKIEKLNKAFYLLICVFLFAVGFLLSKINGRISIHGNFYGRDFIMAIISAVATSSAITMVIMILPNSRFLNFVGKNTLFYLGVHKPLLLVMENLAGEYENHWAFILFGSIFCFLILAPFALIVNKYFPYIVGESIREETKAIRVCKFFAVAASMAVPWSYINNNFMGGILKTTAAYRALSLTAYILIALLIVIIFNYVIPFMFNKKKKAD